MKIKIIGAGLSGLFTAYYLQKLIPPGSRAVQIEIFDYQPESTENASTISLAWLNSAYPCDGKIDQRVSAYDEFRLASLHAWNLVKESLANDGITGEMASDLKPIKIDDQFINSMYVFFNPAQQDEFMQMIDRLKAYQRSYQANDVAKEKLVEHFPLLDNLAKDIRICNISKELLVNPYILRRQLITYLQKNQVIFHWGVPVSAEDIAADPKSNWIVAAGNGSPPLLKNTKLDQIDFIKDSVAEVIYCKLTHPVDLKGKVFHIAPTDTTPGFHLRNNDNDMTTLKIVIDYDARKENDLDKNAQAIFRLLQLGVKSYQCINTIKRPLTKDGRPLVEMNLGRNINIHFVMGHNLYSIASVLYPAFAGNVAFMINKSSNKLIFLPIGYSKKLVPFSLSDRFPPRLRFNTVSSNPTTKEYGLFVQNKKQMVQRHEKHFENRNHLAKL